MKKIFLMIFCSMFLVVSLVNFAVAKQEKPEKHTMTKKQIEEKLLAGNVLITSDVMEVKKIKSVIMEMKKKQSRERIVYLYLKRAEHYKIESNSAKYPANRTNSLKLARILISIAEDCSDEFPKINKQAKELRETLR